LIQSKPSTTLNVYAAFMPSADELAADVMGSKLTALTGRIQEFRD